MVKFDVFISYSSSDVSFAEAVEALLSEAGLQVWRDKTRLEAGSTFSEALIDGIRSSSVFLGLFSKAYFDSDWCRDELGVAIGADVRLFPVRIEKDLSYDQIKGIIAQRHIPTFGEDLPGLDELSAAVGAAAQVPPRVERSAVPLLPPDHLDRVELAGLRAAVVEPTCTLLGLTGLPGSGKTTLAARLASDEKVLGSFPGGVWWVERSASLSGALDYQQQLYTQLAPAGSAFGVQSVAEGLVALRRNARDGRSLVVLDDPAPADLEPALEAIRFSGNVTILVLSASRGALSAARLDREAIREIGGFTPAEARVYLARAVSTDRPLPEAATEAARLLGNLPEALSMLGAWVRLAPDAEVAFEDIVADLRRADLGPVSSPGGGSGELHELISSLLRAATDIEVDRSSDFAMLPPGSALEIETLYELWRPAKDRQTRRLLLSLVAKSLVRQVGRGRYSLHPLLRLHLRSSIEDLPARFDRVTAMVAPAVPPLIVAAVWDDVLAVEGLLASGRDPDAAESRGLTALHAAAEKGHREIAELLLDRGADIDRPATEGMRPLHSALLQRHTALAQLLVERGANVHAATNDGFTSLHLAAQVGELNMVTELLARGADPVRPNTHGLTPLQVAAANGHPSVVRELLGAATLEAQDPDPRPALVEAAVRGFDDVAEVLLEAAAPVDRKRPDGKTALFGAALKGHERAVALLVAAGADPNLADGNGVTSVRAAAQEGHGGIVAALLQSGSDVEGGAAPDGVTPLMAAASEGHTPALEILLDGGADIDRRSGTGSTALCYAVQAAHEGATELLLQKGAAVNIGHEEGWLPIHLALTPALRARSQASFSIGPEGVRFSQASVLHTSNRTLQLLLEAGADPNAKLPDGRTALDLARQARHEVAVQLLLRSGASG